MGPKVKPNPKPAPMRAMPRARPSLVVVSAMKMEHKLVAGVAGTVRSVAARKGANVDQGAELVVVEQHPEKTP